MKNRMIHYHLQQPFSHKPNRKQKEETLKGIPLYNRIKKHNIRMKKQTFMNSELTTIESLLVRSTTAGSDPSHVKSTTSSPYRKDDGV